MSPILRTVRQRGNTGITQILVRHGLLSAAQAEAVRASPEEGSRIQLIVDRGWCTEDQILQVIATEWGLRYVDLADYQIAPDVVQQCPVRLITQRQVLPIGNAHGRLVVATNLPDESDVVDELRCFTGRDIELVLARRNDLLRLIKQTVGVGGGVIDELVAAQSPLDVSVVEGWEGEGNADQASVVGLVNEILWDAVRHRASDIHIEPERHGLVVRYRIDGLLRVEPVPAELDRLRLSIVSRLKIMARLNIAERRLPQDGRITLMSQGREVDVRVSVIPMLYGEGVVLRILDRQRSTFSLKQLAMAPELERRFRELIERPHGIVLVTGPTGSGKTTTLYAAISERRNTATKIITIEDPVEYYLDGISQIQTNARLGLTFSAGVRSVLRHDPNVILVGEIRDTETAQSAMQAALTGHLVLSTLHTNDAASALTRLVDMGVEPYLVASTVQGVLAQRLVRRICRHCRIWKDSDATVPADFGQHPPRLPEARGCRECQETGFDGRIAVFELLQSNAEISQLCLQCASASSLRALARQQGTQSLRQSGWELVRRGETTIDEVLRVVGHESDSS